MRNSHFDCRVDWSTFDDGVEICEDTGSLGYGARRELNFGSHVADSRLSMTFDFLEAG